MVIGDSKPWNLERGTWNLELERKECLRFDVPLKTQNVKLKTLAQRVFVIARSSEAVEGDEAISVPTKAVKAFSAVGRRSAIPGRIAEGHREDQNRTHARNAKVKAEISNSLATPKLLDRRSLGGGG